MKRSHTVLVAAMLVLGACGGDSPSGEEAEASATTANDASTTTAQQTEPSGGAAEASTTTSTPITTVAEATTSTTDPVALVQVLALADIPDCIAGMVDAAAGTADTLALATEFFGFGYEIAPPDGSRFHRADVRLRASAESQRWSISYGVIAPDGIVDDVDINLEDNGPGAVGLANRYDQIMAGLGFTRIGTTGSDPGEPGGPNSLNHVYSPVDDQQIINGVPGRLPNIKIWIEEDIVGGSYSDDIEILGGYSYDYDYETQPGAGSPVPLIGALLEELPLPEGVALTDARVGVNRRDPDSFNYDLGTPYVTIALEWTLPSGTFDNAVEFYSDPTLLGNSAIFMAAEASFFDEGHYEPSTVENGSGGHQDLPMLLLQRYSARFSVGPSTESDPETLEFRLELNPNSPVLDPPS